MNKKGGSRPHESKTIIRDSEWIRPLREERVQKGLSAEKLAAIIGADHCSVLRWERGQAKFFFLQYLNWAEALGYEIVLRKKGDQG